MNRILETDECFPIQSIKLNNKNRNNFYISDDRIIANALFSGMISSFVQDA